MLEKSDVVEKGKIYRPVYSKEEKIFKLEFDRDEFTLPEKLYGDVVQYSEYIKKNFHDYFKKTGCLLTGKQGSGKTLQAYHTCNLMTELGYDVMYIYGEKATDELVRFLNATTFQGVIFIDEFGRVFDWNKIPLVLTTLSDPSFHRLFIITENDTGRLPVDITDRPGRFLFKRDYNRVTDEMIRECCEDKGATEAFADELCYRNRYCSSFTLDVLINVVETHIKFPELTLDEMTEKFSFNSLRLHLKFLTPEVWYKDLCISNRIANKEYIVAYLNTYNFYKLDLSIIKEIINKERMLCLNLRGSFTEKDYEDCIRKIDEEAPVEEAGEQVIESEAMTMKNQGMFGNNPNNNQMPPTFSLTLPKKERDAFKAIETSSGYDLTKTGELYHNEQEQELIFVVTDDLKVIVKYETSATNTYAGKPGRYDF